MQRAQLRAVGQCFYQFGQGGITGVVVLAESHLSIHTWPETAYVTIDVYVCNYSGDNAHKAEKLLQNLIALFLPRHPLIQRIQRGTLHRELTHKENHDST